MYGSCGKVMYSYVSVSQSVCPQGDSHVTITQDAMDLTVHGPHTSDMEPPWPWPWPCPLLVTSGGHHWRPVQTFSLEDPPPLTPPPLVLTSGGDTEACTVGKRTVPTGMLSSIIVVIAFCINLGNACARWVSNITIQTYQSRIQEKYF